MPVVLRARGYRFWFYEADLVEPPHVHVGKQGKEAKFWLNPVRIARTGRFHQADLREIEGLIEENLGFLLGAWEQEKDKHVNG